MNNTNKISSSQNFIPKSCSYGCNTKIYWNTSENAYFEVFSENGHQCPNRRQQQGKKSNNITSTIAKPNYYKKSYYTTQQNQQLLLQQLVILNQHIIAKNPGPIHNNQNPKYLIHLNY